MLDAEHHETGDVPDVDICGVSTRKSTRDAGLRKGDAGVNVADDAGCGVDVVEGGGGDEWGAGDEADARELGPQQPPFFQG